MFFRIAGMLVKNAKREGEIVILRKCKCRET
jgi:hypothetical protein